MITLTLAFLACAAPPEVVDSDSGGTDTQPVDTGSPPQSVWSLTVLSEEEGLSVAVFDFVLGSEGISDAGLLESATVTEGSVTLDLVAPVEADLQVLNPELPELKVRYALALAFEDTNGDKLHNPGEAFIGGLDYGLMYVENPSSVMEFLGFRSGWNAFRTLGSFTEVVDLQGLQLQPSLATRTQMEISGTYDENFGPARAAALPVAWFSDPDFTAVIADTELGGSWTMSFDGAPPASHMLPADDPNLPGGALDLPFAYLDNDGNEAWTLGQDQPVLPLCFQGEKALAVWLPQAPTVEVALSYLGAGLAPGWVLAQQGESGLDFLGAEAYAALSYSADCGF